MQDADQRVIHSAVLSHAPFKPKLRIAKADDGGWLCYLPPHRISIATTFGDTPLDAYSNWMLIFGMDD